MSYSTDFLNKHAFEWRERGGGHMHTEIQTNKEHEKMTVIMLKRGG